MSAATVVRDLDNFKSSGSANRKLSRETPVVVVRSTEEFMGPKARSKGLSWKTFVGLTSVLLAGVFALDHPWKSHSPQPVSAGSAAQKAPRSVNVGRPAAAGTLSVVLPATVRPWQTTTLHARVSGYLTAWHKDLGAQVKAGELLAEIETPELDQQLIEGEALVREAEAAAAQAKAERVEAQADLKVAEAQMVRTQAETDLAKLLLGRRAKLVQTRAVSQEEYDTSFTQVEARTADVAAAVSEIARLRTNLETRAAIIEVREAVVKSRQANVGRLQELQIFKRIVAPFDGTVTRRTAEVGMLVTAGQESLFVLEDMSRVRVQMNVPQTYAMQTSPGVVALISVPESVVQGIRGTITRVTDSVDSASRTMLAEVELENASHQFQPGSFAQVTLTTSQGNTAWTIPTNTLQMRVDGPHVAVVNDLNQIEIKRVKLGRDMGTRVVVTDGIRGDERLVINPSDSLTHGLQIQVGREESAQEIARR
jgi:multidrug efflux pump subunit AcrA (membrane-fusion protein)